MHHVSRLRPLAFCLAALFAAPAFSATVIGQVNNEAHKPVAGVSVKLIAADGSTIATKVTNDRGGVSFADVRPGHYTLEAVQPKASNIRQAVEVTDAATASATLELPPASKLTTMEISATRLKEARIALSPSVGTTVYTVDQQLVAGLSQGENTPLNEVLLHLPGVAQDSKASGSLHVRDEHANVQYRINGIQLPEGISGFGQSVDTRFADKIDFLTGALPAQYGLRTAGIVDVQTKEGSFKPGGSVGVLVGGHDTFQPSAELLGSKGPLSYYFTGSLLTNTLGIENPTPESNAIHDRTKQLKGFGYMSYLLDENTRVALMLGTYDGRFQIPNNPGQMPGFSLTGVSDATAGTSTLPSSQLDERQRELNHYVVLALQKTVGPFDYQLAAFRQYSSLHFVPDGIGDLVYNGVASDAFRSNSATGIQADASYKLNAAHTVRFGGGYTRQITRNENSVSVFATDASGAQLSSDPLTIADNSDKLGRLASVYLQDEYRLSPRFTVNYGLRFDQVSAFTDESQWSPRINALYKLTDATSVHAGYSRYFTPPPQELVAQSSINKFAGTTNAPEVAVSDNVRAERTHYFDVGVTQTISPGLTLGVDGYYKRITNLLDEGQFGQALILTPFNYAQGFAEGVEFAATYTHAQWSGYLNAAVSEAKGKNIVSGQSLFGADELAYIANNYVYLDHDQRYTVSGGLSYRFGTNRVSGDVIYGSGLRRTPDGAPPNSGSLAAYTQVNLTFIREWKKTMFGDLEGRIAVLNVFDESYLIRDGSGVGVGAPQYGPRRTLYAGFLSKF
jgi:outer membrane receptor protein involved in Fe transport